MGGWVHGWMNGGGAANTLLNDPKSWWLIGFPHCLCLEHGVTYLCQCLAGHGYVQCVGCLLSVAGPLLCTEGSVWGSFYKAGRNGSRGWQGPGPTSVPSNLSEAREQSVLDH